MGFHLFLPRFLQAPQQLLLVYLASYQVEQQWQSKGDPSSISVIVDSNAVVKLNRFSQDKSGSDNHEKQQTRQLGHVDTIVL